MMHAQAPSFLLVSCTCEPGQHLAYRDVHDEALVWCCDLCAQPVNLDEVAHQWVDVETMRSLGFVIEGFEPELKHGDGGCRGGSCGVQQ